jgi:hypothetical protein
VTFKRKSEKQIVARHLVAWVMLFAMGIQLFWGSGFLLDYYTNTEAYKELCINKDKPALNCDGKCVLAEKIMASESKNKESKKSSFPPIPEISSIFLSSKFTISFHSEDILLTHKTITLNFFFTKEIVEIDKPPT